MCQAGSERYPDGTHTFRLKVDEHEYRTRISCPITWAELDDLCQNLIYEARRRR